MIWWVWKRGGTLFGVDLSEIFGIRFFLDLSRCSLNLTIICVTAGVEIKIEHSDSYSLRAARIKRSDFDVR